MNSHSRKSFYVINNINFVTRLNFDENLTSDKFVSVWKLMFWTSVIISEYIWTFASIWSLETLKIYHFCFTSQFFCFHFLSESYKEGGMGGGGVDLRDESSHRVIGFRSF